jgi:hypothetical protein
MESNLHLEHLTFLHKILSNAPLQITLQDS